MSKVRPPHSYRPSLLILLPATLFGLIACSKTESSVGNAQASEAAKPVTATPASTGGAAAPAAGEGGDIVAYAQKQLDANYKGTQREPPTTATKPDKGKTVWIISPGQIGESASIATNAAKEAGEVLGWKMTIYDSK